MNFKEIPRDWQNHAMDCFRAGTLVVTERGEVPIENVRVGDQALTRFGYRKVLAIKEGHVADELVRLTLSNGRVLEATPDHEVWTETRGWVPLKHLLESDIMFGCEPMSSFSREYGTTATRIVPRESVESTFIPQGVRRSTGRYTKLNTALSRKASTFITWIATLSTMIRETSYSLIQYFIRGGIGKTGNPELSYALGAANPTGRSLESRDFCSAVATVKPPLVVPGGKTTSTRCACGAAECSGSGSISSATIIVPSCALRVVGKETLRGAFPVHDVVVEGAHEVVANGVIASQCWGYFIWTMKRFADEEGQEGYDYNSFEITPDEIPDDPADPTVYREGVNRYLSEPSPALTMKDRAHLFTRQYRREVYSSPMAAQSYLEPAGRR